MKRRFVFNFFRKPRQGFQQQQRWASLAATSQFRNEQSLNPLLLGSTAALSVLAWNYFSEQHKANACGIVGYVGEESSVNFLLEGLRILQNRGYDSAGKFFGGLERSPKKTKKKAFFPLSFLISPHCRPFRQKKKKGLFL